MTKFRDLFERLQADFTGGQVKTRKGGNGSSVRYATARTFMNRLDEVLGPENWWDDYTPGEDSVTCRLTIRLPDGTTLTKSDAGGYAGMADQGDDDKSGFSDAFKRACVKFGPGRHLYNDGMPTLRDAIALPDDSAAQAVPTAEVSGNIRGTPVPQKEAVEPSAVRPEPEPAGLIGNPLSEHNNIPFWDYLNDECLKANMDYRHETGDGNGCVDIKSAVKTVVDMTKRGGCHNHDPNVKRTAKQWAQVVNEIADANTENREWMIEYLNSHIKIARETATLEVSQGKR